MLFHDRDHRSSSFNAALHLLFPQTIELISCQSVVGKDSSFVYGTPINPYVILDFI